MLAAVALGGTPLHADESRRLFDVAPVSASNPVVATIDGRIEIPLGELRAFQQAERLHALAPDARLADKRAILNDLISEYLLVDEAYRAGVPQAPRFVGQMQATRTLMLADELAGQLHAARPDATPAGAATASLATRLFDEATLDVSNEAYEVARRTAAAINATTAAARTGPVVNPPEVLTDQLAALVQRAPDAVLVRYGGDQTLRVHEVLAIYAGLPPPRPDVQTHDSFLAMIKPLIVPHLMAAQAARDGLAATPDFQRRLTRNQNVLLRFHMHGEIESEANRQLAQPDLEEKLRAWHRAHRTEYRVGDGGLATFAEAKERVLADYSVALVEDLKRAKVTRLRSSHRIAIDDAVLESWQP
jgi:hypothetical protein